ncbi:hypothetical protein P167DRAFT_533523, partial [Morchella conica CCBAS932]
MMWDRTTQRVSNMRTRDIIVLYVRMYVGNIGPRTTAAEVDPIDVNLEHLQITEQPDNLNQKFLPRVLDIYIVEFSKQLDWTLT